MRSSGPSRIVALLGLALLTVAACGGGSSAGPADRAVDRAATLRVALNTPPPTLDPHTPSSPIAQFAYTAPVYDRLTQIGPGLEVRPMLATSWQIADDRRSVTFTLRDGVTFSDGAPVDAASVEASLERGITLPESTVRPSLSAIAGVTAVDPRTVRVDAARSAADIPAILAGAEGSIVSPNALGAPDLDRNPVGSGAYVLESLRLGESAVYVRREGYWDPEAQQAARLEMRFMPDNNARTSALRSNEVDLAVAAENQIDQLESASGVEVSTYPQAATINMRLNSGRPHLSDPRVRQALNFAIDREQLDASLLGGQCPPIGQPLPEVYPGHLATPPVTYTHDPARAKQLLAEAGLPDGFAMRILVGAGNQPFEQLAPAIQAQFAEVGIGAEIVSQAAPAIFTTWAGGEYDGYVTVSHTYATAPLTLAATFQSPRTYPGPRPAEFDAAMATATDPASDPQQVQAAVTEASTAATEQAMNLWLCGRQTLVAATDEVVGADTMGVSSFAGIIDLRYVGVRGSD